MRCQDLQGIHFVRQLTHLDDKQKQQAEVCTYFQKFEEAQQIYIGMERPDLALKMRRKLGDWFRVVQLIKNGAGGDDQLLNQAWNSIGTYYFDRQRYQEASRFFAQGNNSNGTTCPIRSEPMAAARPFPTPTPMPEALAGAFRDAWNRGTLDLMRWRSNICAAV